MKDTANLVALKECYEGVKHKSDTWRVWSMPDVRKVYEEGSLPVLLAKHIRETLSMLETVIWQDLQKKIEEKANG